jgi:hypothetical protein
MHQLLTERGAHDNTQKLLQFSDKSIRPLGLLGVTKQIASHSASRHRLGGGAYRRIVVCRE